MLTPDDARLLGAGKWFAGLPPHIASLLLAAAERTRLPAGSLLFARGDENNGIYGVLQGTVRFGAASAAGREAVVGLAQPSQWFGEVSMFGGRRTHDAWTETEVVLAWLRRPALCELLAREPLLWMHLGQLLAHKLERVFENLEAQALRPPRSRLARLLLDLATGYEQRREPVDRLRVSQERLGTLLSLSRQTVNTLLGEIERAGAIRLGRGGLQIVDLARLRALAG